MLLKFNSVQFPEWIGSVYCYAPDKKEQSRMIGMECSLRERCILQCGMTDLGDPGAAVDFWSYLHPAVFER